MSYIQEPPFAIQVELTEGCNLFCSFCGINGIREKAGDYKFMTIKTATVLANRIKESGWTSRLEFALHGEPLLNPDKYTIFKIFRDALPKHQMMLCTNGTVPTVTSKLFEYLDIVAIDKYSDEPHKIIRDTNVKVYNYPLEPEGNPHRRQKKGVKFITVIQSIREANKGTHSNLNNHCGSAAPLDYSQIDKRCAKPFRELSVRWDGNVAACCNSFTGMFKVANINNTNLNDIWMHNRFVALRKFMYNGMRELSPCYGCNAKSYRVGILPDKLGKSELEKPTVEDYKIINDAISEGHLTTPIKRPWDK